MKNIFITGGTGFLGAELIKEILFRSDDNIFALVRGKNAEDARKRLFTLFEKDFPANTLDSKLKHRIKVLAGDIVHKNFGLSDEDLSFLAENTDIVFNNAALTELTMPLEEIQKANVNGTKNVLDFSLMCKKNGKLKKTNHISTAYVVGTKVCEFHENDLNLGQEFNNTYEQSKYAAEEVVYKYRENGLDIDIFRPGIILGRCSDGMTTNFKMFYQPLKIFSTNMYPRIPALSNSRPNLINVDTVARAVTAVMYASKTPNTNYHIVSPDYPVLQDVLGTASEYFGFSMPEFVAKDEINMRQEYSPAKRLMLEPFVPYLNYVTTFAMGNTLSALKNTDFKFPEFDKDNLVRLFEYCDRTGFIKRKKKNVVVK